MKDCNSVENMQITFSKSGQSLRRQWKFEYAKILKKCKKTSLGHSRGVHKPHQSPFFMVCLSPVFRTIYFHVFIGDACACRVPSLGQRFCRILSRRLQLHRESVIPITRRSDHNACKPLHTMVCSCKCACKIPRSRRMLFVRADGSVARKS